MQETAHMVTLKKKKRKKGCDSQFVRIHTVSEFTSSELSKIAFDWWQP